MSIDGATRFANVQRKFSKTNNRMQTLCQILRMVTVEIAINSTHGAALCLTSCPYCIAFEVMLLVSVIDYYSLALALGPKSLLTLLLLLKWDYIICRPHEHGEDMLAPMSTILNDYSEQRHSSAICIVLRGLRALCESEVNIHVLVGWCK